MRCLLSITIDSIRVPSAHPSLVVVDWRFVIAHRDGKDHARTVTASRALDPDVAVVSFNDSLSDRQAHAKAGIATLVQHPGLGRLKEPFENALT
jgi:hypothetical protein